MFSEDSNSSTAVLVHNVQSYYGFFKIEIMYSWLESSRDFGVTLAKTKFTKTRRI